jgi:hypothetical protein
MIEMSEFREYGSKTFKVETRNKLRKLNLILKIKTVGLKIGIEHTKYYAMRGGNRACVVSR